ncbi:M23 family metallopeptidase [Kutzneria sp. CA-103260]|uniref:M23 family metallopeptidase n=1 Tax=Kutzneria sp. CA-103260 TaxID=2802641 RepID=UPI001BAA42DA|nr:M23 family metallopeptidase [Kutzneria sp. CA-103260]QUQ71516.1 Peptidase family M23 [Kutzneria sp. CA-103260]
MPTALVLASLLLTLVVQAWPPAPAALATAPADRPQSSIAPTITRPSRPPISPAAIAFLTALPFPAAHLLLPLPVIRAKPPPATTRYDWPLAPPHPVLRPFQRPSSPYGPGHRGVDLGADAGQPVLAAADGVVSFAGSVATRGVVAVAHAGGLRTTYEPVQPEVTAGQRVRRGEEVGRLMPGHEEGAAACLRSACLHWGALRGNEYLDPLGLLSTQRVRLLPWREPPPEEVA